ncbi:MAG: O-antigen ligase family protein [bacterium]
MAIVGVANSALVAATTVLGPIPGALALFCLIALAVLAISPISLVTILALLSHVVEVGSLDQATVRFVKWATIGGIAWVALLRVLSLRKTASRTLTLGSFEKWFLIYIGWCLVCSLFADHPLGSTVEVLRQAALFLVYVIARHTVQTSRQARIVMRAILASVLLACFWSLIADRAGFLRITGLFVNSNALGQFLFIGLAALLIGWRLERQRLMRVLFVVGAILALLCLLMTWSRTSWGATFVMLVAYLILEKRKKLLLQLSSLILAGVLLFVSSQYFNTLLATAGRLQFGTTHRVTLWRFGTASALEHPVFGRGFDLTKGELRNALPISGFGEAYTLAGSDQAFNPHNYFVLITLSAGIPGLLIFIIILSKLFKTQLRARSLARDHDSHFIATILLAMLAGVVFIAMFEMGPLLGSGSYANYLWILLGVVAAIRDRGLRF